MYSILKEEATQEESYSLSRFEKEIESMNCAYQVLRSFIRYSSRTRDGELIAIAAVRKMQNILE